MSSDALMETLLDWWAKPWSNDKNADLCGLANTITDRFELVRQVDIPEVKPDEDGVLRPVVGYSGAPGADTYASSAYHRWSAGLSLARAAYYEASEREQATLAARRDLLTVELLGDEYTGDSCGAYSKAYPSTRRAVDRIIELQDRVAS